ncbi:MAG: trypsin-like peptidase domain-containing protein, partial [Bacteroidales bacterium]|nr:trypsin-like peptidase domain-containing protein [Bacteroidales bacterium]
MKGQLIIYILFFLSSLILQGQQEFPEGRALFPAVDSWHEIGIDPLHAEAMRAIDQPKGQPWQFAIPVKVSLNPDNSGFIIRSDNETVWILPVSSKGALSLNLILSPFRLPKGAYIYIYDPEKQVVRGAFTSESTAGTRSLPVLPVPGDRLVLECHFPGNVIPENSIGVSQVAHDFTGFFGPEGIKDYYYGRSDYCEVDLKCSTNQNYLMASRSVVRLIVAGSELCTGVLVNNTGNEYKAYVLTANHCIENDEQAENTIFTFNYKSPWCSGPDVSNMYALTGSLLRAENPDIDFTLVELTQFPSMVYKPYFSGWDITATPPTNTFSMHHPEGDVMKLTIDDNAPISTSYPVSGFLDLGFWRVLRWETGTTEPGSSGGPLFDQNGRLRGTLTGGGATCSDPTNDYFAKLSMMFNVTTVVSSHLRPWLDPAGTGATVAAGRDPYGYNLSRSDTLGGFPATVSGTTDAYSSPGWGFSTGNNSDGLMRYAEYIPFSGTGEIAWLRLRVAASSLLSATDSVRFYIWSGGSQPGPVIASRKLKLGEIKSGQVLEIDFGRNIKVTAPFYAGYSVYYRTPPDQPHPQFAVMHSSPWPT